MTVYYWFFVFFSSHFLISVTLLSYFYPIILAFAYHGGPYWVWVWRAFSLHFISLSIEKTIAFLKFWPPLGLTDEV